MSERPHFATLDGLRGVAAITVLASHCINPFDLERLIPHAGQAVDFFFCLSGFVIGYAYEKRLMLRAMSFAAFVATRMIRLYPLILIGLMLGLAVFVAKAIVVSHTPLTLKLLVVVALEAFLIPNPLGLGEGWASLAPLDAPAWSLFFEFAANFAYAAFVTRLTKPVMNFLLICTASIVFVQAYMVGGVHGGNYWDNLWGGFGRVSFPFLCGLYLFRRWNVHPSGRSRKAAALLPIMLLGVLLCPVPPSMTWLYESLAVVAAFPLIVGIGALDVPGPRMTSFYLFLGRLSYPLYILHYPLVHVFSNFARSHALHGAKFWLFIAIEMLGVIGFSLVVMKVLDEPVRAWLTRKWRAWRHDAVHVTLA